MSNTPGRTREINFFKVNEQFVLVDLPGYGYARISKERKKEWLPLIEGYLRGSPALRGVVQLLDVRHPASDDDLQMLDFLAELGAPTIVVLTKIDKLRPRELVTRLHEMAVQLQLDEEQMIPFSATTNVGRDDLAAAVVSLVERRRGAARIVPRSEIRGAWQRSTVFRRSAVFSQRAQRTQRTAFRVAMFARRMVPRHPRPQMV